MPGGNWSMKQNIHLLLQERYSLISPFSNSTPSSSSVSYTHLDVYKRQGSLLPIILFFTFFQVVSLKLKKKTLIKILVGILYTYIGLVLFLTGVNVGFMPVGNYLGQVIAGLSYLYLIHISDTGIGIPENETDRIFERFYRVDKSHSKETGGTGLGLSIVKHGAMLHGAKIHVDSKLGEGTKIELIF